MRNKKYTITTNKKMTISLLSNDNVNVGDCGSGGDVGTSSMNVSFLLDA